MRTPSPRTLLLALGLLAACADDPAGNQDQVSDAARQSALTQTRQVLLSERALGTAQWVEDLTHGPAVGLADEAMGLDMELGSEMPQFAGESNYSLSSRLAQADRSRRSTDLRASELTFGKTDPQPGDVLYQETRTNLDGSVTTLRVIQDSPNSVVRVVADTVWPHGHLLLSSTHDEVVVDRGALLDDDSDDVLLALASDLRFRTGAVLARSIDERAVGGIRDGARIDVSSAFTPRPNHPLLVSITSTFTLDVHQLSDESDDRFVAATRDTQLRGVAHDGGSPRVNESLSVEEPVAEGEEPCGGQARREIHFARSCDIEDWTDMAEFACSGGGQLSRAIHYADGTTASLTLREDAVGVVTLDALERDGASTTGRFENGAFSIDTLYAPGSDPVRRSIDGISNPSGSEWSLDEQVEYADGFVEENHLEGRELADRKELAGSHVGRDESVEFELASNADETQFSGSIRNDQGESLSFDVEILPDLSQVIDFIAENPTTRVEGHLVIAADGCGEGTLVIEEGGNRATIDVQWCDSVLRDDAGNFLTL